MNRLSTISLMLLLCGSSLSQDCPYYYSEQPPQTLTCDPYETRELRLECTAYGPASAEFHLAWLSDSTNGPLQGADGAELIRTSERHISILSQVQEQGDTRIIRSQLRIQLQRNASTAIRAFWCSVTVATSSDSMALQTVPSEGFVLHDAARYSHLPGCGDRAQSSHREKCALQLSVTSNTVTSPVPRPTHMTPSSLSTKTPVSPYPTQSPSSGVVSLHRAQSTWQHPAPSSQLPSPSTSVLPGTPPVMEERRGLGTIVFPILACFFGVLSMLCLVTCVYTQCYRRRKNAAIEKKFATANHTYSLSNSIYHCERQGFNQAPATPSLSSPFKLSESQNISTWSNDQYVEMATSQDRARGQSGPSSSTINRSGLQSSLKAPFSYEVPLPSCLDPDYASIPTLYDQYLIPTEMDLGLYENSPNQRQQSPSSCDDMYILPPPKIWHCPPSPAPPPATPPSNGHHYEEVIHTSVNTAYHETDIPVPPSAPVAADST